jgi:indolepyruvate ferredoxin oxidoreductase beta subunit
LVEVTDYLKPRLEEMVSILPPGSANKVLKLFGQTKLAEKGFKLKINATHVSGFVVMRLLARLKRFRRGSYREAIEMERIKSWMAEILRCGGSNYDLALEVAACARLVKGYGPTHCRGSENFAKVIGLSEEQKTPERVRQMREILLAEGPA